ncbi:MAG: ankyrin repeat domain-containing protein [Planctomycetia bacterium]
MNTELHKSIRSGIKVGDIATVTTLLDSTPDAATMDTPFGSWLHVAASFGQTKIVELLLDRYKLDINCRGGVAGGNALHRAASDGHTEVVRVLLARGSEMDVSEPERNPLFGAIVGGNVEIAKQLLEHGIDSSVRYTGEVMKDTAALDFARERGAQEFASLLGG